MAETSFPFEGIDTTEAQFGQWASTIAGGSGVIIYNNNLAVSGDDSGMQVRVATGRAIVRGVFYENTTQATVAIAAADASNPRYDAVVLRLDLVANTISLKVVTGTPAASPTYPNVTQTDTGIYENLLAYVYVGAGVTSISAAVVTDARVWFRNSQPDNSRFLLMGA